MDLKEAFDDAVIYNHLLIGTSDKVYFINLSNLQITESEVEMYFGYFILRKEAVYILDGTGIIAFNERLEEIWRNHRLAIDGVTFREMLDDEIMIVSYEMDPPGGWVARKINIKNGKVVEISTLEVEVCGEVNDMGKYFHVKNAANFLCSGFCVH